VILLKIKNVLCTKRTKNKKGRPKPTKKVTIEPIPSMRIVAEQFLVLLCIPETELFRISVLRVEYY
jgi:hypothetical protein